MPLRCLPYWFSSPVLHRYQRLSEGSIFRSMHQRMAVAMLSVRQCSRALFGLSIMRSTCVSLLGFRTV